MVNGRLPSVMALHNGALEISVFHGALGGWGWEVVGPSGEIFAESPYQFESAEDCMQDALKQIAVAAA